MRRILVCMVLLVTMLFFLGACKEENNAAVDNDTDIEAMVKETQAVHIVDMVGITGVMTDDKEIADFIRSLKLDEWELKEVPRDVVVDKSIQLYKIETIKVSDSASTEKDLKDVGSIIVFEESPYVEFLLGSLTFGFQVPDDVAKYLAELE